MKFGDRVQLEDKYKNYKGKDIITQYGCFTKALSKVLSGKEFVCIAWGEETCILRKKTGPLLNDYEQYYLPTEIIEIVVDENKYTELELQAHKNDSFEKGVEKGIEEEKKDRDEVLDLAVVQAFKKGKLEGTVEASKEYLSEKDINPSVLSEVWENGYNAKSGYDEGYDAGYKEGSNKVQSDEFEELLEYENPTYEHHPHYLMIPLMNIVEENGFKLIGYNDETDVNIHISIKINK